MIDIATLHLIMFLDISNERKGIIVNLCLYMFLVISKERNRTIAILTFIMFLGIINEKRKSNRSTLPLKMQRHLLE